MHIQKNLYTKREKQTHKGIYYSLSYTKASTALQLPVKASWISWTMGYSAHGRLWLFRLSKSISSSKSERASELQKYAFNQVVSHKKYREFSKDVFFFQDCKYLKCQYYEWKSNLRNSKECRTTTALVRTAISAYKHMFRFMHDLLDWSMTRDKLIKKTQK